MSYCRFSSDGFQSDVYCYESASGFVVHVACRRHPRRITAFDGVNWGNPSQIAEACEEQGRQLNAPGNEPVRIGLPHDGKTFTEATPGEMADRLLWLRSEGYNVPQDAIDDLMEEARS